GLGCALGAKLAARDRLVIGTHGDGSYMFGNPISAHYVGAEQELPVLTVLFNNQRWQAVRRATVGLNREGFAAKNNHQPITFLDSISNYQKAVEVADGYGEKVTDPAEMMPALERGLRAVNVEKRQAVINVICSAKKKATERRGLRSQRYYLITELPSGSRPVRFMRNRREHFVGIAKLGCYLEHFRVMQQGTIEHAVGID